MAQIQQSSISHIRLKTLLKKCPEYVAGGNEIESIARGVCHAINTNGDTKTTKKDIDNFLKVAVTFMEKIGVASTIQSILYLRRSPYYSLESYAPYDKDRSGPIPHKDMELRELFLISFDYAALVYLREYIKTRGEDPTVIAFMLKNELSMMIKLDEGFMYFNQWKSYLTQRARDMFTKIDKPEYYAYATVFSNMSYDFVNLHNQIFNALRDGNVANFKGLVL